MKKEHLEDLQAHLEQHPLIEKIYFNSKGEWQFHSHPHFQIEKTREQVMEKNFSLKPKEAKAAVALGEKTGSHLMTQEEKTLIDEGNSEVIPVDEKLKHPDLAKHAGPEITTTELTDDKVVIVNQPVLPHEVVPPAKDDKHSKDTTKK